jgi:hypothetical protein
MALAWGTRRRGAATLIGLTLALTVAGVATTGTASAAAQSPQAGTGTRAAAVANGQRGEAQLAGGHSRATVTVNPATDITGGTVVVVQITGPPSTHVVVAQCARPVKQTLGRSQCLPPAPIDLVLDPSGGTGALTLTIQASIPPPSTGGSRVTCGTDHCAVAVFGTDPTNRANSRLLASAPIGLRTTNEPLSLTVAPDHDLANNQSVDVTVHGRQDQIVALYQCDASIVTNGRDPSAGDAPCALVNYAFIADGDIRVVNMPVVLNLVTAAGSTPCGETPGRCVIAGLAADGTDFATAPISFAPIGTMTLTPATGLVDRQQVTVDAAGLRPGGTYGLVHCTSPPIGVSPTYPCEDPATAPHVVASPDGTISTTAEPLQRFTETHAFPAACNLPICVLALLATDPGGRGIEAMAPYEMAQGTLAAEPATGLTDGQTITLTGENLMDSYDGPDIWVFHTGEWGIAQCDRAVTDDLSIHSIFNHCALPPEGSTVTVTGAHLATPITVQATIHTMSGDTTDCTTTTDACVLLLARIEQNSAITTHIAPISFS